jgi:DNA polymerase/3'-5' exonuclease PolX
MDNPTIARELLRHARDLAADGDNLYRVRAFRQAAGVIQALDRPVVDLIATSGARGLRVLPGVGPSLAKTIAELAVMKTLTKAG